MRPTVRRRNSRLIALAVGSLLLAVILMAKYHARSDTASLQIIGHALSSPAGTDSTVYMNMGEAAFRTPGHRIFSDLFFKEHQKFIYPPSSLFLTEMLALGSHLNVPSQAGLGAILLLGWSGTLVLAVLLYRTQRGAVTLVDGACIVLLGVIFLPLAEGLYRGQVQVVLTCLWGLAVLLWSKSRHGWAGAVLALTCAFKPQMGLFLIWGILRREWRFTWIFFATLTAIEVVSVVHFGWRNSLDYLAVLNYISHHGEALWANQSVNGVMNRVLGNGDAMSWNPTVYPPYRTAVYFVSTAFSLIAVLTGLFIPWRGGWPATTADFLFFGGVATIASPIVWEHHYSIFFFLLIYLLAFSERLTQVRWVVLVGCALAMANRLPPLDHHLRGLSSLIGAYLFLAGIAILTLVAVEMRDRRTEDPSFGVQADESLLNA
jgi:alpha-1,2-mannosyltransferase